MQEDILSSTWESDSDGDKRCNKTKKEVDTIRSLIHEFGSDDAVNCLKDGSVEDVEDLALDVRLKLARQKVAELMGIPSDL
jgi:hypothetical protein